MKGSLCCLKVKRFEDELDSIKGCESGSTAEESSAAADRLERLLRRMRLTLHEDHYWALEAKRRLVDLYGKAKGFQMNKMPMVGA